MCGSWFMGSPFDGMMSGFGRAGMYVPFLIGLGILILVIVLVVTLVQKNRMAGGPQPENRAMQILKERYVRGEITQTEYQMMVKDIH